MAISPITRSSDPELAKRNVEYASSMSDFEVDELTSLMSLPEAFVIDTTAHMGGDVLDAGVTDQAMSCRLNTQLYDDELEDYLYGSQALNEYADAMRKDASHENAERVRLLRSARAVLYLYMQGEFVRTECPVELLPTVEVVE